VFVAMYAVRRHVRRKYPDVPPEYTAFKLNLKGPKRPRNTFTRVFLEHRYFTIPVLAVLIYTLKWAGLLDPIEDFTGWTEYWVGLALAALMVVALSICGWCYDRYVEWRVMRQPEGSTPAAPSP
jgi:hypothetical protein